MEDNNRISVIVPVYNTKAYLEDCIESILKQKHQNLEVLLVDDGSTDGSGAICDLYADKDARVKVLRQENAGQGAARNRALDICTGDYIAFVDSDDRITEDMFSSMVAVMERERCDVVICGIRSISTYTGRQVDGKVLPRLTILEKENIMEAYLTGKIFTGMCDKLYKAQLFESIRFPTSRCREDVYILHEVLGSAQRLAFLPQIGYIQNIRAGSTEQRTYEISRAEQTELVLQRQRTYIAEKYPSLYKYTALSLAKLYYATCKEIMCRDNLRRSSEEYRLYYEKLKMELQMIDAENLPSMFRGEYRKMYKAVENTTYLYFEVFPVFIKQKLRNMLAAIRG